jgi:glyoxylase-like metal-dependent hydrolase (beta-lactamase superfamily II)
VRLSIVSESDSFAICGLCGVQFSEPSHPDVCVQCGADDRGSLRDGQVWTTLAELRKTHRNVIGDEAGFVGICTEPAFGNGQRALLVPWRGSNLMWDCVTLLDDETAEAVERRGGLAAIAVSHPHFYSAMVEWAQRFDCPVYLHEGDERFVERSDPRIEFWRGDRNDLGDGVTLIHVGGHFPGSQVLHTATQSAVLHGDAVIMTSDPNWVTFDYSWVQGIPLSPAATRVTLDALEPYEFDSMIGAWGGWVVPHDAKQVLRRSGERFIRMVGGGELPAPAAAG